MRFEYKKWGSGNYEVIWLYDYNPISRTFRTKSIGMVEKQGRKWAATKSGLEAPTRKELAEIMARLIS